MPIKLDIMGEIGSYYVHFGLDPVFVPTEDGIEERECGGDEFGGIL